MIGPLWRWFVCLCAVWFCARLLCAPQSAARIPEAYEQLATDLSTIWDYGGIAVGTIDGPNTLGSLLMPDVIFTVEDGVRISISPDDPSSPFTLAGHGAFYRVVDGGYVGIIGADPLNAQGPSDLCSSGALTTG